MRRVWVLCLVAVIAGNLISCAASSQSTIGVDCNYDGRPMWEMPVACQGR